MNRGTSETTAQQAKPVIQKTRLAIFSLIFSERKLFYLFLELVDSPNSIACLLLEPRRREMLELHRSKTPEENAFSERFPFLKKN